MAPGPGPLVALLSAKPVLRHDHQGRLHPHCDTGHRGWSVLQNERPSFAPQVFCCMPTTLSACVALTTASRGNAAVALLLTVTTNMLGVRQPTWGSMHCTEHRAQPSAQCLACALPRRPGVSDTPAL